MLKRPSPLTIHTSFDEQFTAIGAPTLWYRGFKLEQWAGQIRVYDMSGDRPRIVYGDYAGEEKWTELCRWIDETYPGTDPNPVHSYYQEQQRSWQETYEGPKTPAEHEDESLFRDQVRDSKDAL